jgi:hypothetical protein
MDDISHFVPGLFVWIPSWIHRQAIDRCYGHPCHDEALARQPTTEREDLKSGFDLESRLQNHEAGW